ncbi:MAG: Radical domain protein [Firmicutes bacterium]|nr:Radical domain protein [Bacillota bacterium]
MFDNAEGMVFRPPSEANSFILRVTIGCAHNKCTFCSMYRDVQFRARPISEIEPIIRNTARRYPDLRRVFLADGDALVLSTNKLLEIIALLKVNFPKLSRISCYGGPLDILRKSPEDLLILKQAGLQMVYLGIESGDDEVLALVQKGVTGDEMIAAGQKILAAGMKLSAMLVLGLGGRDLSLQHARNSGRVASAINPTMLSALTLMLHRGTPLRADAEQGRFHPLSPYDFVQELKELIEHLDMKTPCIFRSNHVSNMLPLAGTLPGDKNSLLEQAEDALELLKNQTRPTFNDDGPF